MLNYTFVPASLGRYIFFYIHFYSALYQYIYVDTVYQTHQLNIISIFVFSNIIYININIILRYSFDFLLYLLSFMW